MLLPPSENLMPEHRERNVADSWHGTPRNTESSEVLADQLPLHEQLLKENKVVGFQTPDDNTKIVVRRYPEVENPRTDGPGSDPISLFVAKPYISIRKGYRDSTTEVGGPKSGGWETPLVLGDELLNTTELAQACQDTIQEGGLVYPVWLLETKDRIELHLRNREDNQPPPLETEGEGKVEEVGALLLSREQVESMAAANSHRSRYRFRDAVWDTLQDEVKAYTAYMNNECYNITVESVNHGEERHIHAFAVKPGMHAVDFDYWAWGAQEAFDVVDLLLEGMDDENGLAAAVIQPVAD